MNKPRLHNTTSLMNFVLLAEFRQLVASIEIQYKISIFLCLQDVNTVQCHSQPHRP